MTKLYPLLTAACLAFAFNAHAQDQTDKPLTSKPAPQVMDAKSEQDWEAKLHTTDCSKMPNRMLMVDCTLMHSQTRTIHLKNVRQQNDANEILVATRNLFDPSTKIILISSENAISISSYPEDLDRMEAYIHSIDRPRPTYHLTYTMVESDSGKRIGIQHYTLTVVDGQRSTMKEGSKVPVSTGSFSSTDKSMQQQFTYLDVGMNFDATLNQIGDQVQLKTKIEQSAVADSQNIAGVQEPVIRQSVFEGFATLTPGKPSTIGAIDVPGSTRHLDIEALVEPTP